MSALFRPLHEAFSPDFMRQALLAGVLVGGLCGYLGVYVVLKRVVFVGVALAELSSAGVALALWVAALLGLEVGDHSPLTVAGAVGLMLVGVMLFSVRSAQPRVPAESGIGIGYAVAAAAGVLLVAHSAKGEEHVMRMMFGNILYVSMHEIEEFAIAGTIVAAVHALFAKEMLFASFDPEMAATQGYRVQRLELLFHLLLGITIAFAIRVAGVLLVFALLVLPAVTALLLTQRLRQAFPVSVLFGVLPVGIGLYVSYARDLPSAACIVMVSFIVLAGAGLVTAVRGT